MSTICSTHSALPFAVFNGSNQVLVRRDATGLPRLPDGEELIGANIPVPFTWRGENGILGRLGENLSALSPGWVWLTWDELARNLPDQENVASPYAKLEKELYRVPYLDKKDNDYIYRFRTERQRNRDVYHLDESSHRLYHSSICTAIKALRRVNERRSDAPASLNFGPVEYLLPSHFGFCLGVQNAIERAYESLAAHPGKRLFMLSELIHNPFVNEDLRRRGLRYLQTDKGEPCRDEDSGEYYWDLLTAGDVVIIPAFGATNEDKTRLVARGVCFQEHDATCMLVEKVWKAARDFGREGYTVLIHGKSEHEETKATFSNTLPFAPCLIIRDLAETRNLIDLIAMADPVAQRERFEREFAAKASPGFDPRRDLEKIAVVNQTTLLRNETLGIIQYLETAFTGLYGEEESQRRLARKSQGDTLCYATQVNQDALERCLEDDLDYAFVVGGKNSSNTFQLFRMAETKLGDHAYYIQSEENILNPETIRHYAYSKTASKNTGQTGLQERPFSLRRNPDRPLRILITGGASCPDGLIEQIIARLNGFFPSSKLRPVTDVLAELS